MPELEGYDAYVKLDRYDRKARHFFLTPDRDLFVCAGSKKTKIATYFQFSTDHLVADFNAAISLKDLTDAYFATLKPLWKILEDIGLNPWERVINDYLEPNSLEEVAKRHGMKPTTLSKELKAREVPLHFGRLPRTFDPSELKLALRDNPSVNELRQRLRCSWKTADKVRNGKTLKEEFFSAYENVHLGNVSAAETGKPPLATLLRTDG